MTMSPLVTSAVFAPTPPTKEEAEFRTKPMPAGKGASEGGITAKTRAQDGAQPQPDFAMLIMASCPEGQVAGVAGKVPAQKTSQDRAFAEFLAQVDALVLKLQGETGDLDLSQTVTAFVGILEAFDAKVGSDFVTVLADALAGLEPDGLVLLQEAAPDPAAVITSLAELAGLFPADEVLAPAPSANRPSLWMQAPTEISHRTQTARDLESAERPLPARLASETVIKPHAQPNAPSFDARVDVRAVVMTALAAAGIGPEAEAAPQIVAQSDLRPPLPAAADGNAARPIVPPPPSGFARNLVQQIRSASFTDGQTRISLSPRGLGEVEIDMRPDEAGKLRIILRAENPAVLQALRGDRDGLLLTLSESGTDLRDADLSFEDFSHRQRRDQEGAETLALPRDIAGAEAIDVSKAHVRLNLSGRLDIFT
jgi:hypothetical protein